MNPNKYLDKVNRINNAFVVTKKAYDEKQISRNDYQAVVKTLQEEVLKMMAQATQADEYEECMEALSGSLEFGEESELTLEDLKGFPVLNDNPANKSMATSQKPSVKWTSSNMADLILDIHREQDVNDFIAMM